MGVSQLYVMAQVAASKDHVTNWSSNPFAPLESSTSSSNLSNIFTERTQWHRTVCWQHNLTMLLLAMHEHVQEKWFWCCSCFTVLWWERVVISDKWPCIEDTEGSYSNVLQSSVMLCLLPSSWIKLFTTLTCKPVTEHVVTSVPLLSCCCPYVMRTVRTYEI